jgi:serine/threonine-protein phosphatase 2B regulatory subunit
VEQINFKQFVSTLSVFSPKAPRAEKVKSTYQCNASSTCTQSTLLPVAFKVYDVNGDGFVTDDDLLYVLKLMVGDNLAEDQLKAIVKRTITAADKGKR